MLSQNPFLRNLSPGFKVLFFFFALLILGSLLTITMLTIITTIVGVSGDELEGILRGAEHPQAKTILYWGNIANQVGGFLIIALLFRTVFGKESVGGFYLKKPPLWGWIAPLALILALPLVELSIYINDWLIPAGSVLEETVLETSEGIKAVTKTMLQMDGPGDLLLNLLFLALLPAICEEFAFRGVIQNQIAKATGRMHVSVWLSASIFSIYHMQADYFLPRLILGALLGYILVHTGSLILSIVAHFVNNALFVVTTYVAGPEALETDPTGEYLSSPFVVVGFLALLAGLIYFTLPKSKWPSIKEEYMEWEPVPLTDEL